MKSKTMQFIDKLPEYDKKMQDINELGEMLGDLGRAFAGEPLNRNYDRPEEHDCKLSEEDSCEGCDIIAEILENRNG